MRPNTQYRMAGSRYLVFFMHATTGTEIWRSRMPSIPQTNEIVSTTDRHFRVVRTAGHLVYVMPT